MSTMNRWREPIAWAATGISAGYLLLSVLRLVRLCASEHYGFTRAASLLSGGVLPLGMLTAVVLAALACALLKPRSPSADTVLKASAGVVALSAVMELVLMVAGFFAPDEGAFGVLLSALGGLLSIGFKVLLGWLLMHLVEASARPATSAGQRPADPPQGTVPGLQAPGPGTAPVWRAEDAVGTVWNRAGDAASGAAGQHPGAGSTGWQASVGQPGAHQAATRAGGPTRTPSAASPWSGGDGDPEQTHHAGQWGVGQGRATAAGEWNRAEEWPPAGGPSRPVQGASTGAWDAGRPLVPDAAPTGRQDQPGTAWNQTTTGWNTPADSQWNTSWQAPQAPDPSARASAWATADDVARGRVVPRGDLGELSSDDGESTIMRPAPQWRPADDDQR